MLRVFGLGSTSSLSEEVISSLKKMNVLIDPSSYKKVTFSDGEMEVRFDTPIRGDDVFLIQSTVSSDSIIELLLAIDAAKHASANTVTAVIPYFGYARQDRKSVPRVSVGAKVIAKCIESVGADRVITIDLHAPQEQCFFDIPVDHIPASSIFFGTLNLDNTWVIASPDMGGAKRAEKYAKHFGLPLVVCHKHRSEVNKVDSMMVIGDVEGKNVLLVDDMIDTAGTICKAATLLKSMGALSVDVVATHGVFSKPALSRITESCIDHVFVTNSFPHEKDLVVYSKITEVSCGQLLASVILSIVKNESISQFLV